MSDLRKIVIIGTIGGICIGAAKIRLIAMSNIELCGRYMKLVAKVDTEEYRHSYIMHLRYTWYRNECIRRSLI